MIDHCQLKPLKQTTLKFEQNTQVFFQLHVFQNVVCKMATILLSRQCVSNEYRNSNRCMGSEQRFHISRLIKATFTLCPSPCPSPCPYQSPCPNNSHFLIKLEAVFRLHQFPYQSPIQCHQISVRSVSIGPPTARPWKTDTDVRFYPNLASPYTKPHFDVWRGSCGHKIKSKTDTNSDSM